MTTSAIANAIHTLADMARFGIETFGMGREDAIKVAVTSALDSARAARLRQAQFRFETSTEDINAALFLGSVAADVRDNTFRPSVGNARDYMLTVL